MITVDQKEIIRREYFIKRKSMRQIAREFKHSRKTIRKAIMDPGIPVYTEEARGQTGDRSVPAHHQAVAGRGPAAACQTAPYSQEDL